MTETICIDPGTQTGIAIYKNGNLVELKTLTFWETIRVIDYNWEVKFVVEVPKTKSVWHANANKATCVNVGMVLGHIKILVEYLDINSINYRTVTPKGKITHKQFVEKTGWTRRTNQHERDAAMLYYY